MATLARDSAKSKSSWPRQECAGIQRRRGMRGARGDEARIRRGREIQADVKEFIASDHVYGSQIKDLTESRKFALDRALADAAHLGGVASKYSKSLHGAVLGLEVAEHWYALQDGQVGGQPRVHLLMGGQGLIATVENLAV